jgi:transposase
MKAYSMDLRVRVLADSNAGMRSGLVSEKYGVSSAWVRRLKQRRRETGRIGPFSQRHGPLPKLTGHEDELMALVRRQSDATAKELSRRLSIKVSRPTVQKMLQRLRLTYKKRH